MKNLSLKIPITIIGILLILLSSCKKDDEKPINQTNDKTSAVFNPNLSYATMTDQDGNIYKTITIGTQTWMAENLRTTHYRNGKAIPNVTDYSTWINLSSGAYCNPFNTNNLDTIATYGRLYNWYVVSNSNNIVPIGWHVPTDNEWSILIDYLGGNGNSRDSIACWKMKETGILHWTVLDARNTNESGFTALPSGYRHFGQDLFYPFGTCSFYWSNVSYNADEAWGISIWKMVYKDFYYKKIGISVRCIKD